MEPSSRFYGDCQCQEPGKPEKIETLRFMGLTRASCSARLATMKTAAANRHSRADSKYAGLVEDGLRELKTIQQELRQSRASTERLRAESGRVMKETWAVLHRV